MHPLSLVPEPDTAPVCQFPLTDGICRRPVDMADYRGGQLPQYCDDPEHTAGRAYKIRKGARDNGKRQFAAPKRPVTDGVTSLATLLQRLGSIRNKLIAILSETADVTAGIADPTAITHEVDRVRRDAEGKIAAADSARAAAEYMAARVSEGAERDQQLAAAATAAAEEAQADRDRIQAHADKEIGRAKSRLLEMEADMRQQLTAASSAVAVAQHERDAAVRISEAKTQEAVQLRAQLDELLATQNQALRDEISALRRRS